MVYGRNRLLGPVPETTTTRIIDHLSPQTSTSSSSGKHIYLYHMSRSHATNTPGLVDYHKGRFRYFMYIWAKDIEHWNMDTGMSLRIAIAEHRDLPLLRATTLLPSVY